MTLNTESDCGASGAEAEPVGDPRPAKRAPKRLALFLDGTWNDPDANTNVWRLYAATAEQNLTDGVRQMRYYDPGVGSGRFDRIRGGVAGYGLEDNIRAAYQWLVQNYDGEDGSKPGDDQIFIFGFSRGAFTARSLAGFMMRCGLIYPGAAISIPELFARYQQGKLVRQLHEVKFAHDNPGAAAAAPTDDELWLLANARRVRIRFVGVFDTVGALGGPFGSKRKYRFHNTRLGKLYDHAYQALAVDEHRELYKPELWTQFSEDGKVWAKDTEVEQRWFNGAHSNVGGGYPQDPLATLPLCWMQGKAESCGLAFRHSTCARGDEHTVVPTDSYAQFLKGLYRLVTLGRRHYRGIDVSSTPYPVTGGFARTMKETLDESVIRRCEASKPEDLPPNLRPLCRGNA